MILNYYGAAGGVREYLLQWAKELETALAEAFDHADI